MTNGTNNEERDKYRLSWNLTSCSRYHNFAQLIFLGFAQSFPASGYENLQYGIGEDSVDVDVEENEVDKNPAISSENEKNGNKNNAKLKNSQENTKSNNHKEQPVTEDSGITDKNLSLEANINRKCHVSDFIKSPSLKNPSVSFFGANGLHGFQKVFYIIKVPYITVVNVVRLLLEFSLYVPEAGFRRLLNICQKSWYKRNSNWETLAVVGILLAGFGVYLFKTARQTVRLITDPINLIKSAWAIQPVLGIITGLLAITAFTVAIKFTLPLLLPYISKLVATTALPLLPKIIAAVKDAPAYLYLVVPAAIKSFMLLTSLTYHYLQRKADKNKTNSKTNEQSGRVKNEPNELSNSLRDRRSLC